MGKLGKVLIVLAVITAVVVAGLGIYIATGPHNVVEAVAKKPLVGPSANYEANVTVSLRADVDGIELPDVSLPVKVRVADNRYRIEVFADTDDPHAAYELFLEKTDSGWSYSTQGDASELLALAAAGAAAFGVSGGDVGALGELPDFASMEFELPNVLQLIDDAGFEKNADGYSVSIAGSDVSHTLIDAAGGDRTGFDGPFGDALDKASLRVSYDFDGKPVSIALDGVDVSSSIDAGFLGNMSVYLDADVSGTFDRIGQVSADEVTMP